jgi:hypothetical protein
MVNYKPVIISKASFAFCRFSLAVMVWCAFLLKSEIILAIVCLIFLLSAILKVKKAPMIRLYDLTFNKIKKAKDILVDENSIFFAHCLAFLLSLVCLILVHTIPQPKVWYIVLGFALLKTVSAFGFCPASKLYDCTLNGNCCMHKDKNGTQQSC